MNLLLIEDNVEGSRVQHLFQEVQDALPDGQPTAIRLTQTPDCPSALALLRERAFDVILLDLQLQEGQDWQPLLTLRAAVPEVPIVVLTGKIEEIWAGRALEQGAEDYLLRDHLEQHLLLRFLHYVCERVRLRQELSQSRQREQELQELRLLERYAPQTPVSTQIFSLPSLKEYAQQEFATFVAEFARLTYASLEQRLYRSDQHLPEQLEVLGEKLGRWNATPGDVVDIYRQALAQCEEGATEKKRKAYGEESRLLLLGLMAKLVSYYRSRTVLHRPADERKATP